MKKSIKIICLVFGIIVLLVGIDIGSILLRNKPIFAIEKNNIYYGLLYDTYNCQEYSIPQIKTIWSNYSCSFESKIDKTNENDLFNEEKENNHMNIKINGINYNVNLENNETINELIKLLPLDITMKELNGNEKYYYLDNELPTNSKNVKKIKAGDIMLYGNNCLVIFYKDFNTSYSYTRIGNIDNLNNNLGNDNINVEFSK